MKYYAVSNPKGFANTARVYVFANKSLRDDYVSNNDSARAISRSEIKDWVDAPKPFSGKSRGILSVDGFHPDQAFGEVVCDYSDALHPL